MTETQVQGPRLKFKLTALQVLMSVLALRYSSTFSRLPPLAALRKLALSSDCNKENIHMKSFVELQR